MGKITYGKVIEYEVLELVDAFYPEKYLISSSEQLSLYFLNGWYDVIFTNSILKNKVYRIFHVNESKENEAKDFFKELSNKLLEYFCESSSPCFNLAIMQSLCDLIRTKTNWSTAHIAVAAGIKNIYSRDGPLSELIDSQQCDDLYTPLHMASRLKVQEIASSLVAGGADLSRRDIQGNIPLHLAVEGMSKDIFETISSAADEKILNMENNKGETALHVACRCNQAEMCKVLIRDGADPFYSVSIPLPIHYALKYKAHKAANVLLRTVPHISSVMDANIPINVGSKREKVKKLFRQLGSKGKEKTDPDTYMHSLISSGHVDEVVTMIIENAPLNITDHNGNTPLHFSVMHDHVMLVKMLLVFGADYSVENNNRDTPICLAEKSSMLHKQAILALLTSESQTSFTSKITEICRNQEHKSKPKGGYKVLCLDGSGIRALILTQILMEIEKCCDMKAKDIFDWIAGTSAGGVLAICLAQGKSARYVQRLYFRLKDELFVGTRPYCIDGFLIDEFGIEETMESLTNGPKVLIASVKADRKPVQLHFFKNYKTTDLNTTLNDKISDEVSEADYKILQKKSPTLKMPLWKAACCSVAAPTYFRPKEGFIDGGMLANNPTLDTMSEIHRYNEASLKEQRKKIDVVLSLGTGYMKQKLARSVDIYRPKNPKELIDAAKAGIELGQMIIEVTSESNGHVVERARSWCEMMGTSYFRLNPTMKEEIALDEVNNMKILDLMWRTRMYLKENADLFAGVIAALRSS